MAARTLPTGTLLSVAPDGWLFVNGKVFTPRGVAEALAIGRGRITSVGSSREVTEAADRSGERIDLEGRLVLPGFQDAHVHPASAGLKRLRCDLALAKDASEAFATISAYAASHPKLPWIVGGGWSMDWFPGGTPGSDELDAIVPDRPVMLINRDGHGAWVNSVALARAGLDASTPDPSDGRIERLADGRPQGTLHEGAMDLVEQAAPSDTSADYELGLLEAQEYLISLGITGWQDAWVDPLIHEAYRRVVGRGELKARVVGALRWDRHRDLEQVDELEARRAEAVGGYAPTTVKLMLDGVCENFTASMLVPYLDRSGNPTSNRGLDFIDPDELKRIVSELDHRGFQCHFHAIGDRAVRSALDAVEAARSVSGDRDLRHHIAHIQVIHPDDVPRFGRLGVVANAQAYWACEEGYQVDLTIPFLGPERAQWQYPFGDLVRSGARLAMGSDWSVSTPDPLKQIEVAVTRVAPYDRGHRPFLPSQALDVEVCIEAFTAGSAYVNHLEALTGTIEVGKAADLVVLDRDILDPRAGPVGGAVADLTMIGGRLVYVR